MKKLSKEKRSQLILVALLTAGVIVGLWFGLIAMQKEKISEIDKKIKDTQEQMDKVQKVVVDAAQVEASLKFSSERVDEIEKDMPSGDLFSWIVNAVKKFNTPGYKVDMPQFGVPVVGGVIMMPEFPYNQTAVAVSGSAYYYDFGKFVADFENRFPYMRIQNVSIEPGGGTTPEERERLAFRMEILTLIRTNAP
ncbi:MAG: hypothetical protein JWR26_2994 [Pedosphaera sp.]|nr:hypothetical protein [Pedosphaera sp.]